jgi:hypothetical protein
MTSLWSVEQTFRCDRKVRLFALELCNATFLHHINRRTIEEEDEKEKESRATIESHTCYETEASRIGHSARRKTSWRSHWLSINSILVSLIFLSALFADRSPTDSSQSRKDDQRSSIFRVIARGNVTDRQVEGTTDSFPYLSTSMYIVVIVN